MALAELEPPQEVKAQAQARFPHTAVQCLVNVAMHHGISTSAERLIHDYALTAEEPDDRLLLRMARELGLKAKAERMSWPDLQRLDGVFPVLARLKNGNTVIVVGLKRTPEKIDVAVVDPLMAQAGIALVPSNAFCDAWTGTLVFLKRTWSMNDPQQPFGLRWFIPELLREKKVFRDIAIAALTLHILALALPMFTQLVIDKVLVHQTYTTLYVLTAGVVAAILFEAGFSALRQFLLLFATNKVDIRLTVKTFSHLLALPIDYFEMTSTGVVSRHMQQVEKIRQFLTGRLFLTALDSTALLIFIPLLLMYSVKLTVVVLLFAAMVAVVVGLMIGPFRRRLTHLYNAEAQRQAMMVETIGGMRTIKSLALEPLQRKRWSERAAEAIDRHYGVGKISIFANTLVSVIERLQGVVVLAFGVHLVFDQEISVGALIAFNMLSGRVVHPLVQIVGLVQEYQETALSVRMLGEVMNRPPERRPGATGVRLPFKGRIQFDGISFRYPGASVPALTDISLDIQAGSLVGIVGRSGSGKSTLTRIVQGLYPVQEGLVRLDGVDTREIDLAHLRRSIGVVLQDSFMFRGTIRENIAATKPDARLEEIIHVAKLAGADEFIERLPQGFDTPLEEGATNLSGGQKQRLSIARALLPQPRFLILDEATSALDPDSEAIFMENLGRIRQGRTVLIVSHRLSTLVPCDAIVVLDQGRIRDVGRHADLLNRCDIYRHLWNRQNRSV